MDSILRAPYRTPGTPGPVPAMLPLYTARLP